MERHWANSNPTKQKVCCYPECVSRKARRRDVPVQITGNAHKVTADSVMRTDLVREYPGIFGNEVGLAACTAGDLWLHDTCRKKLFENRPPVIIADALVDEHSDCASNAPVRPPLPPPLAALEILDQ